MVNLFLEKGADINQRDGQKKNQTVIYAAKSRRIIRILLEHGADINIVDKDNNTPLMCARDQKKKILLVRVLAKLNFAGEEIHPKNLECIRKDSYLHWLFTECLSELEEFKTYVIYKDFTLYDLLKMRKQVKKFALLTGKDDFISVLKTERLHVKFSCYVEDLRRLYSEATYKKELVEKAQKNIYESGLNKAFSVPPEVMDIIVEFATDHLYRLRGWSKPFEADTESEPERNSDDSDGEFFGSEFENNRFNFSRHFCLF